MKDEGMINIPMILIYEWQWYNEYMMDDDITSM